MPRTTVAVVGHISAEKRAVEMAAPQAVAAFAALAQPTRLAIFNRLMRAEPDGLAAGRLGGCGPAPRPRLTDRGRVLDVLRHAII